FLPLLINSAGNAGSQSSALMVRALALGDVDKNDWLKLLKKEIVVAILLGLAMSFAVAIIGVVNSNLDVAIVVALSMLAIVLLGSAIGMSLPFLLSKLNLDPATASGPLVTSIADIAGVI